MSIRHVVKTVAVSSAATLCGAALALGLGVGAASANSLVSPDGTTTLSTQGSVTSGTPYTSGQTITISGSANSTLSNANLVANAVPGQSTNNPTGNFYFEECTDVGGTAANLPTGPSNCEAATDDFTSVSKTDDGSFDDPSYAIFALPDSNLGSATMVGTCGQAPNYCVIGIFATNPNTTGFSYPHLFSAPFQSTIGDGQEAGDNPGDGTPEVPLAVGLPLAALAVIGGFTIRNRRRHRREEVAA
jgi:hypothetical protein